MNVDKFISINKYKDALSECIRTNQNHIGFLLASIIDDETEQFNHLKTQLSNNIKGLKSEGIVISEKIDPDCKENPSIIEKIEATEIEKSNGVVENIKEVVEKTTVRVLCNWLSPQDSFNYWKKFSKGNATWNNIQLVVDSDPDFFVVINRPPITETVDKSKTIVFRMEPFMEKNTHMWGEWSSPNPKDFFKVCYHHSEYNNNEWHLSKTYTEMLTFKIDKTENGMSTVLSGKYRDPGHVKRVDFIKFCEKKGMSVHVFGNNKWRYKDFKGSLPVYGKDRAMFPYKYSFNAENNSIKNYYTEKLIDGIMAECLVFYSGCYNIREYIDEKAYVYLELSNFEQDYQKVKEAIDNNLWEDRIDIIRKEKLKIMNYLQFFPRLERIINKQPTKLYLV